MILPQCFGQILEFIDSGLIQVLILGELTDLAFLVGIIILKLLDLLSVVVEFVLLFLTQFFQAVSFGLQVSEFLGHGGQLVI